MKKRVLCVDDNEDTCFMLSVLLEMADYEVTTTLTLMEGLKLARSQQFDLYLLDFRLPDGSGLELCREIRAFDRLTPIIFCSGMSGLEDRQEALVAGAHAYVTKPFEPEGLKQTMHRLLNEPTHARPSL